MLTELLAILAAITFVAATLAIALRRRRAAPGLWLLPAALSATLLVFTLVTVTSEGPIALWDAHSKDLWANQIWFDLLLAAGTAWTLILPRARAASMRPLPWLALIALTGSIGLLAMMARMLYREGAQTSA